MVTHLLKVPVAYTEWKPLVGEENADGSLVKSDDIMVTDCCVCRMKASDTRWHNSFTPVDPEDPYRYPPYDPYTIIECNPDVGCNANPKRRNGSTLRRDMREAC